MALKPTDPKKPEPQPVSFRLTDEVAIRLKTLSKVLNRSQAKVIAELIDQEYQAQVKESARKVNAARSDVESE